MQYSGINIYIYKTLYIHTWSETAIIFSCECVRACVRACVCTATSKMLQVEVIVN